MLMLVTKKTIMQCLFLLLREQCLTRGGIWADDIIVSENIWICGPHKNARVAFSD